MAPLRAEVAPPRRPEPGRGRGRPPILPVKEETPSLPPLPPLTPLERRDFDYSGLAAAIAFADETIRRARRNLQGLKAPTSLLARHKVVII
jgi:hypothetical protein